MVDGQTEAATLEQQEQKELGPGEWMTLSRVTIPTINTTAHLGPGLLARTCSKCAQVFKCEEDLLAHQPVHDTPLTFRRGTFAIEFKTSKELNKFKKDLKAGRATIGLLSFEDLKRKVLEAGTTRSVE